MFIGILFVLLLIALVTWQMLARWQVYRRLKRQGILVQACVTDITHEARLVTQIAGANSTYQRIKYENFLSAQWQDPLTQQVHLFRSQIPDYQQYHIGAPIMILVNPKRLSEYRIQYTSPKRSAKKPLPHAEVPSYEEYQQGYQASAPPNNDKEEEYELPKASYPQQRQNSMSHPELFQKFTK